MPTVFRSGPYRFFFFSSDGPEPPHVHVARDDALAKYWLDPLRHSRSWGFAAHELRSVESIIGQHQTSLLEAWHEYFGQHSG